MFDRGADDHRINFERREGVNTRALSSYEYKVGLDQDEWLQCLTSNVSLTKISYRTL